MSIYIKNEEEYERHLKRVMKLGEEKLGVMEEDNFRTYSISEYEDLKDSLKLIQSIVLQYVANEVVRELMKMASKEGNAE
jgi:hypothetical protein